MNFPQAVASGLRNPTDFKTRAARSEFWWFVLFGWIAQNVAYGIDLYVFSVAKDQNGPAQLVFWVILLVPTVALGVRRLHDTDHKGWWMLIPLLIFVFGFIKGTDGENRFGRDPLQRRASGDASARDQFSRDDPPQDPPRD